ncbi:MAG: Wzz/FepE/Etk N-terminal domain-containing protein [candidate division Zixibacteria bacterium]|nr:Wzz/FepE/Etk N-terminal domain-containing protein [candidate division Zixibacteria bacterium]MDD5425135.1 Wzz/FepE/Etk N-terminal domain-containing protein [candidate division Zixibacteria bacterium]
MNRRISITRKEPENSSVVQGDPLGDVEFNLIEFLRSLVRRKKMISVIVVGVMVLTAGLVLLTPNIYRSNASILPSGSVDKIAELKSYAGLGGKITSDENSSELFPVILKSRVIMDAVLSKNYSYMEKETEKTVTLTGYFGTDNQDELYTCLDRIVSIDYDKKNGVIRLSTETKYPALSQAVLNAFIEELENFNLYKRRSRAKDNVSYLARQLMEKEASLEKARNNLEAFQKQNQNWAGSTNPEIIRVISQLQLAVELNTQGYLYLNQEYELARRELQNDLPIVRILDNPFLPTKKAGPHRMLTVMIAGVLAFLTAVGLIVIMDAFNKRFEGPDRELYLGLRDDVIGDLPVINRIINRVRTSTEDTRTTETSYK